jgi:hypothetical protein
MKSLPHQQNSTSMYGPNASGASVNHISQIRWSTMLVLPVVGN